MLTHGDSWVSPSIETEVLAECASYLQLCRFMELGDLFTALQRDTTGSMLWYRRCVAAAPAFHVNYSPDTLSAPLLGLPGSHRRCSANPSPAAPALLEPACTLHRACVLHTQAFTVMRLPGKGAHLATLCLPFHRCRHGNQVPGLGRRIALDVARGLHFLHTSRIVHMVSIWHPVCFTSMPRLHAARHDCAG